MDKTIRFLLNGASVEITDLPPMTTLLNWLRYDRRLTGTKEGCAEGDCGACTVGLRRVGETGVTTQPVCACIQTLGMVHGAEIVTVEGISPPDGPLHPVQQAMADGHGSQCGFCTPGFVMSLWTAHDHGSPLDLVEVNALLAGNLCRCTGYGPIQGAAAAAHDLPAPDWEDTPRTIADRLTGLDATGLDYAAGGQQFWAPTSVDDFADLVATHPDATILSGATDVGLWVTKHAFDPAKVIYTGRVDGLAQIDRTDGTLILGAGVSYAAAIPALADHFPDMAAMMARIGGAQVRAMGTIGGNIANGSPIGDMPPALIAAGADLVLRKGSTRRALALEDFFIAYGQQDRAPGEFVEAIRVPIPADGARLRCYKISKRRDQDITAVLGCFDVAVAEGIVTSARLVFGGMAGTPARAARTEAVLIGHPWTKEMVTRAQNMLSQDFSPMSDHRGSAQYRLQTARALVWKYFLESTGGTVTRLEDVA